MFGVNPLLDCRRVVGNAISDRVSRGDARLNHERANGKRRDRREEETTRDSAGGTAVHGGPFSMVGGRTGQSSILNEVDCRPSALPTIGARRQQHGADHRGREHT